MTWVKLDDNWCDSPQVFEAGPEAAWLHVCAVSYSNRHLVDGLIPRSMLRRLVTLDDPEAAAERLVQAGMWEPTHDGWLVLDCMEHQPSREKVLELRQKRAAAGKKGGIRSGASRLAKAARGRAGKPAAGDPPAPDSAQGSNDEPTAKQVASSRLEPPARRDGTSSRPTALRAGERGRKRRPVDDGKLPREPEVVAAESAIASLSDAGRKALRMRAVEDLNGDLPAGWERDEGHPWEPQVYGRMVRIMRADIAEENAARRRTGT